MGYSQINFDIDFSLFDYLGETNKKTNQSSAGDSDLLLSLKFLKLYELVYFDYPRVV